MSKIQDILEGLVIILCFGLVIGFVIGIAGVVVYSIWNAVF